MLFRKKKAKEEVINSKFHTSEFVDFWHRDDVYFGIISSIKYNENHEIVYDIDIAGQCPTTFTGILESKVIRIHKD